MIIFESEWHRVSSIREEYLKLTEWAELHRVRNLISWEEFKDSMMRIAGNDVPIDYGGYHVTVSPNGEVKEVYNGETHTINLFD